MFVISAWMLSSEFYWLITSLTLVVCRVWHAAQVDELLAALIGAIQGQIDGKAKHCVGLPSPCTSTRLSGLLVDCWWQRCPFGFVRLAIHGTGLRLVPIICQCHPNSRKTPCLAAEPRGSDFYVPQNHGASLKGNLFIPC